MRSMLTATLIFVASGASAQAQITAPSTAGAKPKPVATVPIRPALQSPADTVNAMAQAERQAIADYERHLVPCEDPECECRDEEPEP